VSKVVEEEEKTFLRTLELGLKRLDHIFEDPKSIKSKILDGQTVFELSDTFGFPVDLTALIAREKGLTIDEEGFKKALSEQKERSRKDAVKEAADWIELGDVDGVEFLGYDFVESEAHLMKYRIVKTKTGEEIHLVLDRTPFYAEMGGQVGDTGTITFEAEGQKIEFTIVDTKKENDLFVHISKNAKLVNVLEKFQEPITVKASIDVNKREKIKKNHTATHLMLSAMRQVLGSHVVQRGSFQNDEVTRFDFSHFSKVTDQEMLAIEDMVNDKIRANIALDEKRNVPIDEAIKLGATATFGEKYGDFVRVITYDPSFSVELCGGTHVPFTGEIGLFKFISEGSVSAGVRRVEAVTGEKALEIMRTQSQTLDILKGLLKGAADLPKAVESLIEEKNQLQKRIEALENEKISALKNILLQKVKAENGIDVLVEKVEVTSIDALRTLAYDLKRDLKKPYLVLGAIINNKPNVAVLIDEQLVTEKSLHAGNIVREASKAMKGGGGGQPHYATAGGSDVSGLGAALLEAYKFIQ
jgi:alanyl-tRNA synthetase